MIYWFQSEMTRPGTGAHKGGPDRAIPRLWAKWQAHDKGAILMVTYVRVNPLAFLLILSLFHIFLSLTFLFLYFSILYFPLLYYPVLYFPILYYPVLYFPALNTPLHVHPISSYLKYLHLIIHCSNFPSYP